MSDLVSRFKSHPRPGGWAATTHQHLPGSARSRSAAEEWFYLLNAPPRAFFELGKTKVFDSPLHASDWISQNLQKSDVQRSMALSFYLPFPGRKSGPKQLSCVPTDPVSIQKYVDFMVKEIQLLGDSVASGVSVPYLHCFANVVKSLTPSELTQLMFHIDRSFKILSMKEARLVFELNEATESAERIALLAGLGFNTACLNDSTNYLGSGSTSELPKLLELLRTYNIDTIYVHLKISGIDSSVLTNIDKLLRYQPAGILLSTDNHPKTPIEAVTLGEVRQALNNANYRSVRNNFFVYQDIDKRPVTHCLQGLGLGAVSYTKKYQICNLTKLDDYYSRLNNGQLPIHSVTELHCEI